MDGKWNTVHPHLPSGLKATWTVRFHSRGQDLSIRSQTGSPLSRLPWPPPVGSLEDIFVTWSWSASRSPDDNARLLLRRHRHGRVLLNRPGSDMPPARLGLRLRTRRLEYNGTPPPAPTSCVHQLRLLLRRAPAGGESTRRRAESGQARPSRSVAARQRAASRWPAAMAFRPSQLAHCLFNY